MKDPKITVVFAEPGQEPGAREIENTLQSLQRLVGGYIECPSFPGEHDLDLIINEEGKLSGMDYNFKLLLPNGLVYDYVVGPAIVCRADEDGNFASLTPEQIAYAISRIKELRLLAY